MYIRGRPPKRRTALIVAIAAFIATLVAVFGFAFLQDPARVAATFPLPDLITRTPTLIGEIEVTPTLRFPTNTRVPTATRTPTQTRTPMATLVPTKTPFPVVEHFVIGRPVSTDVNQLPERFYGYGTTGRGDYEVHHGTDFVNPLGTPVIAVAAGTVIVAGNDSLPQCGAGGNEVCGQYPDFFGNVIVIRLDQRYDGNPIFVAYGHLQRVDVRPGQRVAALEPIGVVGQEGIAVGPHVHLEIRFGANSYTTTRNPVLWMRPLPGMGALAGRLLDKNGEPLRAQSILVYSDAIDGTYIGDTETYSRDAAPPVNSDPVLRENWSFPDLPAGNYIVKAYVGSLQYSRRVTIQPGKLTFVVFGG